MWLKFLSLKNAGSIIDWALRNHFGDAFVDHRDDGLMKEGASYLGPYHLLEKYGMGHQIQLVKIPIVRFSGFHPDLVYARRTSTKELITPHYNSAIAIWAYKHNLDVRESEKLFNKKTFMELGYLNHWEPSIEQLKQRFNNSDLEFAEFILPMRREGLFVYSLNHPKASVRNWPY